MLCADCRATDRAAREYLMAVREFPLETRRQRVDAEAERLAGLGASHVRVLSQEGLDHYGIAMQDPEGNEFDIN